MNLPVRVFFRYLNAFEYVLKNETDEGRKENEANDLIERTHEEVDLVEIWRMKQELKKHTPKKIVKNTVEA